MTRGKKSHLSRLMTKPTKLSLCPAKTQIRVFAVHIKKHWLLSYPLSALRRQIRLDGCPGWSESLLGAQIILLVLPWDGSFTLTCQIGLKPWTNKYVWFCDNSFLGKIYSNKFERQSDGLNSDRSKGAICPFEIDLWKPVSQNIQYTPISLIRLKGKEQKFVYKVFWKLHMSHDRTKSVFRSFRPGQTQTSLRSHRS